MRRIWIALAALTLACGSNDGDGSNGGTGGGGGAGGSGAGGSSGNSGTGGGQVLCIEDGDVGGKLQMPLSGGVDQSLDWGNEGTKCSGALAPQPKTWAFTFFRPDSTIRVDILIDVPSSFDPATGIAAAVWVHDGDQIWTTGADCTLEITEHVSLTASLDRVAGKGSCSAPATAQFTDGGVPDVTIGAFEFVTDTIKLEVFDGG